MAKSDDDNEPSPPKGWDGSGTYEYTGRTVKEFPGPGQMVSVSPGQTFYLTEPIEGLSYKKVSD